MTTESHPVLRRTALSFGLVVAIYLVARGVAEFFLIDYGNSASYRHDWGGPWLIGVLAVHSGPALVILGYAAHRLRAAIRRRAVVPASR